MITCLLVYYEDDEVQDYFVKCAAFVKGYLEESFPDIKIIEIKNHLCNQLYVEAQLSQTNGEDFLFASYCHGSENSFNGPDKLPFISANENEHFLKNGYIFSNSCLSGLQLGPAIIKKGAKLFIGFNEETYVGVEYSSLFAACDNSPILFFLNGSIQLNDKQMLGKKIKDFYNQQIDKLLDKNELLVASWLRHNRDSLVIYL